MQKIPFLDLKQLNAPYMDALKAAAAQVVESGWYIRGSFCEKFEKAFADYCGVKYAVGVGNGLDGLTLMLRAEIELGRLNAGDEILVPSNTYIATLLAVSAAGLVPVLVEPCEKSFNMDPARLDASCGPRTRGILVVHLYGRLADMPAICKFAKERGLLLFEDCAQAHGARLSAAAGDPQACNRPRFAGSFGAAAAYSFYPTKNLGALGDAGMVITDDAEIARVVRMLGNYGSEKKYVNKYRGVNSRLDEMQAAFLLAKLPHLDAWNARRREIAARYVGEVKNPLLRLPEIPADPREHVWHVFTLRTPDRKTRDALQKYLESRGIGTLIFYPIPPHRQEAYAPSPDGRESLLPADRLAGKFPIAESMAETVLSIPVSQVLTDAQVTEIIGALNEFVF
ncbi:DegT/DnrJ/EryC1/StrS aminotransferase family protein [Fibrobacter sp. UWP2]|uniref:DegT/DnrJ/EryC1/StrS family aminotransferase n=1 Tax=Fibrobacter sp. UWP2 TaxID=1896216 RepID=UPI000914D725|nr:DegT/DnrJ/EryC1/StrS family aminotransferase [Fibrobacter sp. UWP2]SHJ36712.1 dTDP-4-amino-4,6-dideoxygalactose transaminase [Fibrobacter sp. UWP2]